MTNDKGTLTLMLVAAAVGASYIVANHLSTPFDDLFDAAGKKHNIDPNLLRAIARRESNFNPKAVSPANRNGTRDYGLMQLNEVTLKALGKSTADALSPSVAIDTAAVLLGQLRRELGDRLSPHTLVAAYNAGAPAIKRRGIFNLPYVESVMTHWQLYAIGRTFA